MSEITITINTDNLAFSERPQVKVYDILDRIACELLSKPLLLTRDNEVDLYDNSGNICGSLTIKNQK